MKLGNISALLILLVAPAMLDAADFSQPSEQPQNRAFDLESGGQSPQSPNDLCDGKWQGPLSEVAYELGMRGFCAVYQDQTETGCMSTYPFEIANVYWMVSNMTMELTFDLRSVIYSVDLSDPLCPRPGVVICRGELITVTAPSPWLDVFTVSLPEGCCVAGPYFAGVEWASLPVNQSLNSVLDDGSSVRTCASYVNTQGVWEDLVGDVDDDGRRNLMIWSDGFSSRQNDCDQCPGHIEAGYDLWQADRDGALFPPSIGFSGETPPIPADFFNPGSDPFEGFIDLTEDPITTSPADALGSADGLIRRADQLTIPATPSSPPATIPIEMVGLSLVGTQPITVTYNGGQNPESWEVRVCLSETTPSMGSISISTGCCSGGSYEATLDIVPRFIFTRPPTSDVRVLDFAWGYPSVYSAFSGQWSAEMHPPNIPGLVTSPGLVEIDHDCYPTSPQITVGQSSRFLLTTGNGEPWFGTPCERCCYARVGNANRSSGDEPTIGDVSVMIDAKFITGTCTGILSCFHESDVNQSGLWDPGCDDITIGDISTLIDYLFITGQSLGLKYCL